MASCVRHPFEQAVDSCGRCSDSLCRDCRVEARRTTYCLDCALAAAGVKSSGRSAKTAATYRKRRNATVVVETTGEEIDLRDGLGGRWG